MNMRIHFFEAAQIFLLQYWLRIVASIFCVLVCQHRLDAQDKVFVRQSSGDTLERSGTIIDWKGSRLTLEIDGRQREYGNDEFVEIRTAWPPTFNDGRKLFKQGNWSEAVAKFRVALGDEDRPWARRTIRAELVRGYLALRKPRPAVEQFLEIAKNDPQTRFWGHCPLPWSGGQQIDRQFAGQLMQSTDPARQLIGASWSLVGEKSDAARVILEELTRDIDSNIRSLAIAQLWRLRAMNLKTITPKQIEVWETQIRSMPTALQAGPWFLIAEIQFRKREIESAVLNFMRLPILYPDRVDLSSAALYQAGHLLHNTGQLAKARGLHSELQQKFPQSVWANQIQQEPRN